MKLDNGTAKNIPQIPKIAPKKKTEREKIIYEIGEREQTTVLFESPHRLIKLLKEFKIN